MDQLTESYNLTFAKSDQEDHDLGLFSSRVAGIFVGTQGTQINFHCDALPAIAQPVDHRCFKLWLFCDANEAIEKGVFTPLESECWRWYRGRWSCT